MLIKSLFYCTYYVYEAICSSENPEIVDEYYNLYPSKYYRL